MALAGVQVTPQAHNAPLPGKLTKPAARAGARNSGLRNPGTSCKQDGADEERLSTSHVRRSTCSEDLPACFQEKQRTSSTALRRGRFSTAGSDSRHARRSVPSSAANITTSPKRGRFSVRDCPDSVSRRLTCRGARPRHGYAPSGRTGIASVRRCANRNPANPGTPHGHWGLCRKGNEPSRKPTRQSTRRRARRAAIAYRRIAPQAERDDHVCPASVLNDRVAGEAVSVSNESGWRATVTIRGNIQRTLAAPSRLLHQTGTLAAMKSHTDAVGHRWPAPAESIQSRGGDV